MKITITTEYPDDPKLLPPEFLLIKCQVERMAGEQQKLIADLQRQLAVTTERAEQAEIERDNNQVKIDELLADIAVAVKANQVVQAQVKRLGEVEGLCMTFVAKRKDFTTGKYELDAWIRNEFYPDIKQALERRE